MHMLPAHFSFRNRYCLSTQIRMVCTHIMRCEWTDVHCERALLVINVHILHVYQQQRAFTADVRPFTSHDVCAYHADLCKQTVSISKREMRWQHHLMSKRVPDVRVHCTLVIRSHMLVELVSAFNRITNHSSRDFVFIVSIAQAASDVIRKT